MGRHAREASPGLVTEHPALNSDEAGGSTV